MRQDDAGQIFWTCWSWGHLKSQNLLLSYFRTKWVPFKGACRQKIAGILNLFMIITQIRPFYTRKHVTALISCKYCLKKRKTKKIQKLYPLLLASPSAAQKRGQKWGKRSKRLRIAQHLHWSELNIIYSSNT